MAFVDISPPIYVSIPKNNGMTVEMPRHPGAVVPIPSGAQGLPGEPGFSPVVSVEEITGGNRVTITDADGDTTFDVMNGAQGARGEPGEGVPSGGATGQVLKKRSNADHDTEWANESGTVLSVNGQTGAVVLDSTDIDHDGEPISDILGGEQTASGNIVTFTDATGGNPITALSVAINPVQSGSGDPSPDNIRPITGWGSVNIWVQPTHDTSATPTATIQLGQTVYGGTLDVINGTMTVDRAVVDLGTPNWVLSAQGFFVTPTAVAGIKAPPQSTVVANIVCSALKTVSAYAIYSGSYGIGVHSNGQVRIRYADMPTDATAFKTAMNGVQLVYELATPVELTLTPTQIQTLVGDNVVWSDAGDVALSVSTGLIGAVETIPTKTSELTNDSGYVNASQAAAAAPVQSVNSATGAVVLDADDVGAMSKWELLWENASPASDFAAQTISIDLSGYDMICILFFDVASSSAQTSRSFFAAVGMAGMLDCTFSHIFRRSATVTSSGVVFGNGSFMGSYPNASMTSNNSFCIPYRIYGIKGVVNT